MECSRGGVKGEKSWRSRSLVRVRGSRLSKRKLLRAVRVTQPLLPPLPGLRNTVPRKWGVWQRLERESDGEITKWSQSRANNVRVGQGQASLGLETRAGREITEAGGCDRAIATTQGKRREKGQIDGESFEVWQVTVAGSRVRRLDKPDPYRSDAGSGAIQVPRHAGSTWTGNGAGQGCWQGQGITGARFEKIAGSILTCLSFNSATGCRIRRRPSLAL